MTYVELVKPPSAWRACPSTPQSVIVSLGSPPSRPAPCPLAPTCLLPVPAGRSVLAGVFRVGGPALSTLPRSAPPELHPGCCPPLTAGQQPSTVGPLGPPLAWCRASGLSPDVGSYKGSWCLKGWEGCVACFLTGDFRVHLHALHRLSPVCGVIQRGKAFDAGGEGRPCLSFCGLWFQCFV